MPNMRFEATGQNVDKKGEIICQYETESIEKIKRV